MPCGDGPSQTAERDHLSHPKSIATDVTTRAPCALPDLNLCQPVDTTLHVVGAHTVCLKPRDTARCATSQRTYLNLCNLWARTDYHCRGPTVVSYLATSEGGIRRQLQNWSPKLAGKQISKINFKWTDRLTATASSDLTHARTLRPVVVACQRWSKHVSFAGACRNSNSLLCS